MAFSYSEEQQAILDSSHGFNMVVANAGVGKTEISSEFVVQRYLVEEAKLFPGKGHVTGADQLKLLKQFKVISFTVKAAGELTTRVYKKFKERGIPIPEEYGREYTLSRTCDAFLQRWLSHPMVMQLWYKWDDRWRGAMKGMFEKLGPGAKKRVAAEAAKLKGDYPIERAMQRLWGPLMDEHMKDALFLAVCSRPALFQEGRRLVNDINTVTKKYLASLTGEEEGKWSAPLYAEIVALVTKFRGPYDKRMVAMDALSLEQQSREEANLKPWMKTEGLARDAGGVYDLARSIGYHPVHTKDNIATRLIVEKIATCDALDSFGILQSICAEVEDLKANIGALDFGDYTQFTKTTFEKFSYVLEKNKEYPVLGIRGKYLIWDEAQDNSLWQYWLLNQLCGNPSSNFHCLVLGDPKQAIYSFRGGNADEFVRNIKFLKEHAPTHLYGLTTSYRSCKKIVSIGNQVGRMLPAAKVEAMDSKGVYHEEGEIVVVPPLRDQKAEFEYVQKQYNAIRSKHGDTSIMLLVRSGLGSHPCTAWIDKLNDPNICILTQHRSKGLEADHVFLLGCTAGKYPDPRSPLEDEVNLFYVAVTRPRMVLYICAPIVLESEEGEEKLTGPSPFLHDTPVLKIISLASGWSEDQLKKGIQGHKALVGMFVSKLKERRMALIEEAKRLFPEVPEVNLTRRRSMNTGARWKKEYRDPDKMYIAPKPLDFDTTKKKYIKK